MTAFAQYRVIEDRESAVATGLFRRDADTAAEGADLPIEGAHGSRRATEVHPSRCRRAESTVGGV